jgi:hypothetical protein
VLRKLIVAAVATGLITSSTLAAPAQAPVPAPAQESVGGQQLWNSTTSPVLLFLVVVGIGVAIAFLADSKDKPASP